MLIILGWANWDDPAFLFTKIVSTRDEALDAWVDNFRSWLYEKGTKFNIDEFKKNPAEHIAATMPYMRIQINEI